MQNPRPINMFAPYMHPAAIERASQVLQSPMIGQGEIVDQFECALQQTIHLPYVVAVNNSASAIRLALSICGVRPGDQVLTTPMTCTLTNHPILEQFAQPVFADVQPDTGNIDPLDVEHRLTDKTKAIVCTHWGGTPCDLDALNQIARRYGIPVIEDASEAFGASYRGRTIGLHSRFVAFSFHAIQIITAGEGGALAVQTAADDGVARMQRWYGIDRKGRQPNGLGYYDFDVTTVGYGYYLTNLAAAIGTENLRTLEQQQARRQAIGEQYWNDLGNVPGLTLLKRHSDRCPSYHFFTVLVENRKEFCRRLHEAGVRASVVHVRNDDYTIFGGRRDDLPGLERFSEHYVGLPIHMHLTDEDVDAVIKSAHAGW